MADNGIDKMDIKREVDSIQKSILERYSSKAISSTQVAGRLDALTRYYQDLEIALENMRLQGK